MKSKNSFQRGFTLIELMIVIVILGILMGTILPRLTGAQGRARDTARRADLANLAQALEVYAGDNGSYPAGAGCLSQDSAVTKNLVTSATALAAYLKGGKIILPGSANMDSNGCIGSYFYAALPKDNVPNAAYVLISDMETWQMANMDLKGAAIAGVPASPGVPAIPAVPVSPAIALNVAITSNAIANTGTNGALYGALAAYNKKFTAEATFSALDSVYFIIP